MRNRALCQVSGSNSRPPSRPLSSLCSIDMKFLLRVLAAAIVQQIQVCKTEQQYIEASKETLHLHQITVSVHENKPAVFPGPSLGNTLTDAVLEVRWLNPKQLEVYRCISGSFFNVSKASQVYGGPLTNLRRIFFTMGKEGMLLCQKLCHEA